MCIGWVVTHLLSHNILSPPEASEASVTFEVLYSLACIAR